MVYHCFTITKAKPFVLDFLYLVFILKTYRDCCGTTSVFLSSFNDTVHWYIRYTLRSVFPPSCLTSVACDPMDVSITLQCPKMILVAVA